MAAVAAIRDCALSVIDALRRTDQPEPTWVAGIPPRLES
jgi:hypothetical protein